jgi:uncharacterized membrane protein
MPPPIDTGAAAADAEWDNESNWRWPGIYFAPRDARLIVPKRPVALFGVKIDLGFTLNFADARALPTFFAVLTLPVLALQLLPRRRRR